MKNGFEEIQSTDIQDLLESQEEDVTEIHSEEILNPQFIKEESSTRTKKMTEKSYVTTGLS